MSLHESGQMYLETIFVLSKESKYVRAIDVGEHLGYSKPSVSRAMSILKKEGYVTADADGYLSLTESGRRVAEDMYSRHTVITRLLVCLGVEEGIASEDACRIEHVISEESFAAMKQHLARFESKEA